MRRARDDVRLAQREKAADVLADFRRRGRGERERRRAAELLQLLADPQVRRTKIVAPLGDAVRLVDGGKGEAAAGERLGELGRAERLRGRHDQHGPARGYARERLAPGRPADGAVETDAGDTAREELGVLILEE